MASVEHPGPFVEVAEELAEQWLHTVESATDPETAYLAFAAFSAVVRSACLRAWQVLPPGPSADAILSDSDYEELCSDLLTLVLGAPVRRSPKGPDGGYDLIYEQRFLNVQAVARTYGQCKRYREAVGVAEVREFLGIIHTNYAVGYFFTTGRLTAKALELLAQNFNIKHNNLCYLVDADRHRECMDALHRFSCGAVGTRPGDTKGMASALSDLRAELIAIVHQHAFPGSRQAQPTLW